MADEIAEILNESNTETQVAATETTETAQETTVTETQVADSVDVPTLTEATPQAEPSTETKAENTTPSFEEQFVQKTGGKKYDDFMSEVEELRKKEFGYKSPLGKLFDELSSNGVKADTIVKLGMQDINKLDNIQAVKLLKEVKESYLSNEEVDALLTSDYLLDADEAVDPKDKLIAGAKLKRDGELAKKELATLQGEVLSVKPQPVDRQKIAEENENQRLQGWQPKTKEVAAKVTKVTMPLSIQVHGEKGVENKKFDFNYPVPKEHLPQIEKIVNDVVTQLNVAPDSQGMESVYKVAYDTYFLQNKDAIIASAVNTALSQQEKFNSKKYNNSQTAKRTVELPGQQPDIATARLEATIASL